MKLRLTFLMSLLFCSLQAQIDIDKKDLLKEYANKSCLCIDSISLTNKGAKENSLEIKKCIDKQVVSFQMIDKLSETLVLSKKGGAEKKANINVEINDNVDSEEFKKYYYKIERHLMQNCTAIKNVSGSQNKEHIMSISKNPKALEYYDKGIRYFKKNNFKKALPYFKKAVKVDDSFVFALDNLGLCYRKLGKLNKALKTYKKSLEIDPFGKMPLQNIAIVYAHKKQYLEAIAAYHNLAKIDPENPEVYYGIGQIYYEYLKDYEKSLRSMCKAYVLYVKLNSPFRADAEKIIGYNYTKLKEQNKVALFNEILKEFKINAN